MTIRSALWWWLMARCLNLLERLADESTRHAPAVERRREVETAAWADLEQMRYAEPARYLAVHGSLLGGRCEWRRV